MIDSEENMTQVTEFRKPKIEDVSFIRDTFMRTPHMACDYSSGNIILWSGVYHTEIACVGQTLFVKYNREGVDYFLFPCGTEDVTEGVKWLEHYCSVKNCTLRFGIIEPAQFEILDNLFPRMYQIEYMRDSADYIYETEKLAKLSGRAYHGKKNHINKFLKNYTDWQYETLTQQNQQEAIKMVEAWCEENHCCEDVGKAAEICVCIKGIENFETLGLVGGVLRVNGAVVAVTLGEPLNNDTFVVHFEKALQAVSGAYTMINQQFVKNEMQAYRYVNREEDMGLEGLRKAKESYKPIFLAEKGIAIKNNCD